MSARSRAGSTPSIAACLAALAAAAAAGGSDPRDTQLEVARSAVEHGIARFARKTLSHLHKEKKYRHRDEVTLLLARCLFQERDHNGAAKLLDGYEEAFPAATRFFLPAAYWLARTDLERARRTDSAQDRAKLLERARRDFERVLADSIEPRLLAGSRFFVGVTLFEAGDHRRALSAFARARKLGVPYSETENLSLNVGRTHLALRNFAEAAREFLTFTEYFPKSPNLPDALYWLGDAYYYLEEWSSAADAYRRSRDAAALRPDPDEVARARYAHGWALTKLGEKRARNRDAKVRESAPQAWEQALPEFESLLGHRREVLRNASTFESGELLFRLGRYGEAAERLLRLTDPDRHPDHAAPALYILGRSRAALGQLLEAAEALGRALDVGAKGDLERRVRFALAEALVESGDPKGAREALEPLKHKSRSPSVRAGARLKMARIARRAAITARRRDRSEVAAAFYAQAHRILGDLAADPAALAELPADEVAYWRGRSADDRGRLDAESAKKGSTKRKRRLALTASADVWFERALGAYREVRKIAGWNEWAEKSLADEAALQAFRGKLDGAVTAYVDLLSHDDLSPEAELAARLRLADAELERGRPKAARAALGPVRKEEHLAAGRAEADYKNAVAHSREKVEDERERKAKTKTALEEFGDFLEAYPESELVPYALAGHGDCLARLGRFPEAASSYERILADFPGYDDIDRVEFAAGDARRLAGQTEAALARYRALFSRGRSDELRARARLEEARIAHAAGKSTEALALAADALAAEGRGRVASEAEELRGAILLRLRRYEEAVGAFRRAAKDDDGAFRAHAKFLQAGTLLAWERSGEAERPADVLRRAARTFTEVSYVSGGGHLKDRAIFGAAEALGELAAVEDAGGRRETAAKELREARKLLDLVSEGEKSRAKIRIEEIEIRLRKLGAPE